MRHVTLRAVSAAVSPLTHMSGTRGNEAIVAREAVIDDTGRAHTIPMLSGNALRHRAVREPGMQWLIRELGLGGRLSIMQLNFLLHGGNLTESTAHENTRRIADMYRLWPLLAVVGGSLRNQIISGNLACWRGTLICRESRAMLERAGFPCEGLALPPAETFVGDYQYTRGDAAASPLVNSDAPGVAASSLMIYSGQCVLPGALFAHGFVLRYREPVELGALLWSLHLWRQAGMSIGGMAGRGHGRLSMRLIAEDLAGADADALMRLYVEYVRGVREEAVAWLSEAWR